jgi:hypothetical protein
MSFSFNFHRLFVRKPDQNRRKPKVLKAQNTHYRGGGCDTINRLSSFNLGCWVTAQTRGPLLFVHQLLHRDPQDVQRAVDVPVPQSATGVTVALCESPAQHQRAVLVRGLPRVLDVAKRAAVTELELASVAKPGTRRQATRGTTTLHSSFTKSMGTAA